MVTLISRSKNSAALISYLMSDQGHNGSKQRNLYTTSVGMYGNRKSLIKQFKRDFKHVDKHKHQVEAIHMIISPSDLEVPYNPSNAQKFGDMVKDFVQTFYPNRRCLICIQQDGVGFTDSATGKVKRILHAHIAISDCDIYSYKGVESKKTGFRYLSKTFDDFVTTKYKIKIDSGRDMPKRRYLKGELIAENERDSEGKFFSYQDDIKNRIGRCIQASESLDDFYKNLQKFGLSVEHKKKKTGEAYQTYYLHTLDNISSESLDKNGKIKSIGSKGQFPGMRSNRQKGYDITDIESRIYNKSKDAATDVLSDEKYHDPEAASRSEFYAFCRENGIDYGQGDAFDKEKHDEAQELYRKYKNKDSEEKSLAEPAQTATKVSAQDIAYNHNTPAPPVDDNEEEYQKELTHKRYQRAKQVLDIDYSSSKQKELSL
ncbi:MAG: relaxase/mobilization nuclease domain-containing protein [Aeriscardovia sp.]|nr:relaxase/mobilization nuclease domain-containing protein [Aeriscardovia sp.]